MRVENALSHYLKAIALGDEDPIAEGYAAYTVGFMKVWNKLWPYSLIIAIVSALLLLVTCWSCCKALCDDDDDEYEYEEEKSDSKKNK